MARTDQPYSCPDFIRPAAKDIAMKDATITYSDLSAYLSQFLGRRHSPAELITFESNQNLKLITKRSPKNNTYHIGFSNDHILPLLSDGVLLGGCLQLHSQEAGHRFYSVMFEEQGVIEEHYLMLDACMESVLLGEIKTLLVQHIQLITIEEFVQQYDPVMYNLNN
jgi:hypothetical protein